MGDIEQNLETLQEVREIGFKLSMDDFGTGFSSLTYLQKMPINCLKIDRSFVDRSDTKSGRDIVEKEMGCNEVQGFFYAKPMARAELHSWLKVNNA